MQNYFNYFTEVEEYFQQKRGAGMLLSTLDWALIDTWREAEIPLAVVFRGIDATFEKWEKRRVKTRRINSLAYCLQEVMGAFEEHKEASVGKGLSTARATPEAIFTLFELNSFLEKASNAIKAAADKLRELPSAGQFVSSGGVEMDTGGQAENPQELAKDFERIVTALGNLKREFPTTSDSGGIDFEQMERRLGALEEKLLSAIKNSIPDLMLANLDAEADRALAPYRQNMRAEMIATLQKQFIHKRLLEQWSLPRLSLFHLQ